MCMLDLPQPSTDLVASLNTVQHTEDNSLSHNSALLNFSLQNITAQMRNRTDSDDYSATDSEDYSATNSDATRPLLRTPMPRPLLRTPMPRPLLRTPMPRPLLRTPMPRSATTDSQCHGPLLRTLMPQLGHYHLVAAMPLMLPRGHSTTCVGLPTSLCLLTYCMHMTIYTIAY